VSRTGAIGQILVVDTERVRGGTRVTFVCGGRALAAFRARRDRLGDVGRLLGVAPLDVVPHVERVLQEVRDRDRKLRDLRATLVQYQAAAWREAAEVVGSLRVVCRAADLESAEVKALAQALVEAPGLVAIVAGTGTPMPVVVARATDVAFDSGACLEAATAALGGRGGGRPDLAQGGLAATVTDLENFVRRYLRERNNGG
jgi:alanyl-tRNA synthetase